MKPEKVRRIVWMVASLAVLLIVAGFWFDTDPNATILGKYSARTMLKLGLITVAGYLGILFLRFLLLLKEYVSDGKRRVVLLTAIALLLLGFAVTEWKLHRSLREAVASRREKIAGFDPFLQVVPKPNDGELNINRWGFRGEEIERTKPSGTYRIFVVGGSTVFARHVDFEPSHPRVLERELRERYPALKIEVQNAGTPWHTSQHSLMKILFKINDFDPDMIIVYHAINDLCRSFSPENFALGPYRSDYSHYLGPIAPMVQEYLKGQTGPRILTLERILTYFRRHWFADFRDVPKPESTSNLSEVSVDDWPSLLAFQRNMKHLAMVVEALDVELVIASQPYLYRNDLNETELKAIRFPASFCRIGRSKADIPSMIEGMEAFNDVSRRVADSRGVLFVDLEKVVPKSLDSFRDDVHYTEEGNGIIGQHLAEQIIANGYIARKFPERAVVSPKSLDPE